MTPKLRPPRALQFQVPRTPVCDRILAHPARVVLIGAPAGYGKSTTMLQLSQRLLEQGTPTAWFTADASDNDVGRFLGFLSSALDPICSASSSPSGEELQMEAGGLLALELIDRVTQHESPFAIFLDNFEVIENPAVLAVVRQLAESLPLTGRLVLGTRNLPDIGLSRLRASGQLLEIGPGELRFSASETGTFIGGQRGVRLRESDVLQLHRRTEGWPIALQLASAALDHRDHPEAFVARFSGSNAVVADYLADEVLARQPEALREFLLRTSILRELGAPLCDVVCKRTDSRDLLTQLQRTNLFLIPVDDEHDTFRYHNVFGDFLRVQLERRLPGEVTGLHRAASDWYRSQQRPLPAIEHALASGDFDYALPLLAREAARLLEAGRVRLLTRWLDMVPPARLSDYPMLRVVRSWAMAFTRGIQEATAALDEVESLRSTHADIGPNIDALRVNLLAMSDRTEEAQILAERSMKDSTAKGSFAFRAMSNALAHGAILSGKFAEGRQLLAAARSAPDGIAGPFNLLYSELQEAVIDLIQGRLRQATVRCRVAAGSRAGGSVGDTQGKALVAILLAEMLYEADDIEQAERLLNLYLSLMQEFSVPELFISGHRSLARIAYDRGENDRSEHLVSELEHLGHRSGLPRAVASAKLERARMALINGDVSFAREELQRCRQVADWPRIHQWATVANEVDSYTIGHLRWMIHSGAADEAVPKLKQELEQAERQLRHRRTLMLRILLALALQRTSHEKAGMRLLRDALRFASDEGFVRIFLDEGPPMLELLQRYASTQLADDDEMAAGRAPRVLLNRLLGADGSKPAPGTAVPSADAVQDPLAKVLTEKELRVLRLLAEGHSNDEIARRMFYSESTVRTHLRNINVKFSVGNRTQAVAVARRLKLVP